MGATWGGDIISLLIVEVCIPSPWRYLQRLVIRTYLPTCRIRLSLYLVLYTLSDPYEYYVTTANLILLRNPPSCRSPHSCHLSRTAGAQSPTQPRGRA